MNSIASPPPSKSLRPWSTRWPERMDLPWSWLADGLADGSRWPRSHRRTVVAVPLALGGSMSSKVSPPGQPSPGQLALVVKRPSVALHGLGVDVDRCVPQPEIGRQCECPGLPPEDTDEIADRSARSMPRFLKISHIGSILYGCEPWQAAQLGVRHWSISAHSPPAGSTSPPAVMGSTATAAGWPSPKGHPGRRRRQRHPGGHHRGHRRAARPGRHPNDRYGTPEISKIATISTT